MVNEEKVKLMTNLALHEQKEKESIKASKYYRKDYIGLNMIWTGILVTIVYLILVAVGVIYKTDYLLNNIMQLDSGSIARKLIVLYIALLGVYMLLAYIVYSIKYRVIQDNNKVYNDTLKKLSKFYRREMNENNELKMGGVDKNDETVGF